MKAILQHRVFYLLAALYVVGAAYFTYREEMAFHAIPVVLLLLYTAFYHLDKLFLFVVLFTPLSVNIEEFVSNNVGLFVPTEPLLFGMLILIALRQIKENHFDTSFIHHPITIIFILQLIWIAMTTVTSELPLVSLKFLLTKLWFIIPIYFFGYVFFKKEKYIYWFLGLFIAALSVAVLYTLVNHAMYGFDEETGHWVMWPFFKDHTSYGAILALIYPIFFGFLFRKESGPLLKATMVFLILLFGFAILMSYTRAAWLSLLGALVVYLLIRFKVRFKYLLMLGMVAGVYVALSWTAIMHSMEKNSAEHATEDQMERIESMTNITTDASNLERLNRWSCAIRLWQERPVLGWGPGTYAMVYAPFQLASQKTIISTNSGNRGNAHSEYLGPLSEQGLPGMLLMIILVGWIIYTGITLHIRLPQGDEKMLTLVLTLGLITYFTHGILNNYLDTDKATVPVWGFTAYLVMLDLKHRVRS